MISIELEILGWCIVATGVVLDWFLHVAWLDLKAINAQAKKIPEVPPGDDVDPRTQRLVDGLLKGAREHQGNSVPRKDN